MADEKLKTRKRGKSYKIESENRDDDNQLNSGQGLKRKMSRKEVRREFRARKKARIHAHFTRRNEKHQIQTNVKKSGLEPEAVGGKCVEKVKKKKRKKRKKQTNNQPDIEDEAFVINQHSTGMYASEDQEMKDLENKLKLNQKKKLPKVFLEEGLSDIIDVCNAIETGSLQLQVQNKKEVEGLTHDDFGKDLALDDESDGYIDESEDDICAEEGLTRDTATASDSDNDLDNKFENASEEDGVLQASSDLNNEDESEDCDCEDEDMSIKEKPLKSQKSSSDIYGGARAKYVPPHQRQQDGEEQTKNKQVNERLRKQVKGLLNRLSESNLSMVSGQIDELYRSHSRNDLNEILSNLLMDACISPSLMPEGLLREHMMLIAILNSLVGSEVGAFLLQKLAVQFDKLHSAENCSNQGKEIVNVVALFAFLYSFKVIDCTLIYDIIRQLVTSFREQDVELLLLLIRLIGLEIRRESPESLKEIILEVQAKAAVDTELTNTSRTRFMLETVNALRNNNMRKIPNYDPSPIDRARKILKSVTHYTDRNDNAKLSISLSDLLSVDQKGRWWIVGSAWSEREKDHSSSLDVHETSDDVKIMELSRQQRMNTDIRRNIFCTIMTSEDYLDAFEKLMRLKLKDKQSREIVYVLMDCSLQEKSYNPFYSYLVQKLCEFSRSYRVTVQYSLWDRFKMASTLTDKNLLNMAHLLVHLLVTKSLSLSVLKVVDFTSLNKKLVTFFSEMLTHILLDYQESTVREVFIRIAPLTKLDTLKESLKLFMKHFLKPKKSTSTPELNTKKLKVVDKQGTLEERINVAIDALSGS